MSVATEERTDVERSWTRVLADGVRSAAQAMIFPVIATALAFAVGAVVIALTGNNVLDAYAALARGAFGGSSAIGRTIVNATPLVFTGLAVAVAFRAGLFNIGGEGQLFVGAVCGAGVGVFMPGPGWLVALAAIVAAGLGGFVWGAIPGLLKGLGAHEVITTIMLNYVGINLTYYLAQNPLSGGGAIPGTDSVEAGVRLAALPFGLGRAHWGFGLALLAAVVAYLFIWRTSRGFELRTVGLAPEAARFAGMPVFANSFLALAVGGLFAGLGGGIEVLGIYGGVSVPFVSNLGFNGIGVALLGRNHPAGVVIGALFFGALASGATQMQFDTGVSLDLASVLLAVVLLLVTATRLIELLLGRRAADIAGAPKLERGLAG